MEKKTNTHTHSNDTCEQKKLAKTMHAAAKTPGTQPRPEEVFWADPGQNGGFSKSQIVKYLGNSRNHEY